MHVDRSVKDVVVTVARFVEERFAGFDAAAGLRETSEQIKFHRCEHERLGAEDRGTCSKIDAQIADYDGFGRSLASDFGRGVERGATKHGPEAGEQLTRRKSFRQVIIGADLEADDAIRLIPARGQHEHGHARFLADTFEYLEAVEPRQHHIENDDMRRGGAWRGGSFDALRAGVHGAHRKIEGLKVRGDKAAKFFVVVDHQHTRETGSVGIGWHRGKRQRAAPLGATADLLT